MPRQHCCEAGAQSYGSGCTSDRQAAEGKVQHHLVREEDPLTKKGVGFYAQATSGDPSFMSASFLPYAFYALSRPRKPSFAVFGGNPQIGTTSNTGFTDSAVSSGSTYTYEVVAYDVAGNFSDASNIAPITVSSSQGGRKGRSKGGAKGGN